jgi:hypothetical protein
MLEVECLRAFVGEAVFKRGQYYVRIVGLPGHFLYGPEDNALGQVGDIAYFLA